VANSDHDVSPVDPAASGGPLSGLLVADISRVLAGPREMIEAGVPRGPINTFDGGIAFASRPAPQSHRRQRIE
jgi:hypothetical protein